MTGRREILHMCRRLRHRFRPRTNRSRKRARSGSNVSGDGHEGDEGSQAATEGEGEGEEPSEVWRKDVSGDATAEAEAAATAAGGGLSGLREMDDEEEDAAVVDDDEGNDKVRETDGDLDEGSDNEADDGPGDGLDEVDEEEAAEAAGPVVVLPLYAMLSPNEQAKVFQPPPPGHRLIVVATNVAETSLTIPNVTYVVDCGRAKERQLHHASGISAFNVTWISRASADQRAGRAGRTGPGHCYRLYSSAVYANHLKQFGDPEVRTRPLEDVVLQMKSMGIRDVARFPFPSQPDPKVSAG